jgi:subtilase family serine protease
VDGFNGVPGDPGQVGEVSLDIEMAISMAPGMSKLIVYEASNDASTAGDILNRIATDNLARQISCSWSLGDDPTFDQIYRQYAAQGQSFFQASGDNGAFTTAWPPPQQESDSPYITIVGGTTLNTTGPEGPWHSEIVWNWNIGTGPDAIDGASGGGISLIYPIPTWQQGISMGLNQGSSSARNVPDVAMVADGIFVIDNNGVNETDIGGTSCAAPLWAGFMALVNQQAAADGLPPVGFINPAIYTIGTGTTYAAAFHDITSGDNETHFSPSRFTAVSGYDLCTGWGTPNGSGLINALTRSACTNVITTSSAPSIGGVRVVVVR